MSWKKALRRHLNSPEHDRPEHEDAERRSAHVEELRLVMRIIARVFREAHGELLAANRRVMFEFGPELHGLVLDGRRLEVRLVDDDDQSQAIAVRRFGAPPSVLRFRDGALVDEQGTRVLSVDAHFGWLVLDLVSPGASEAL